MCMICLLSQCFEGICLFQGRFSVASSSYIKPFGAVFRQIVYFYLMQFSGMLHQNQNFQNDPRTCYKCNLFFMKHLVMARMKIAFLSKLFNIQCTL